MILPSTFRSGWTWAFPEFLAVDSYHHCSFHSMKSLRASTALLAERRAAQAAPRVALAARHIHNPARATPRTALNVPGPSRHHSTTAAPAAPIEPIPEIAPGDSYDIVIIGGGNAGLALACALRKLVITSTSAELTSQWTNLRSARRRVSYFLKEEAWTACAVGQA